MQADPSLFAHVASTPEQVLIIEVLLLAFHDLSSEHEDIRSEAVSFWSSRNGEWARHRRLLLSLIGLDDDAVMPRVRALIPDHLIPVAPEPKQALDVVRRFTPTEIRVNAVRAILPDHDFDLAWLCERLPIGRGQCRHAVRQLIEEGVVSSLGRPARDKRTQYCRTEDLLPLRSAASR